MADALFEDARSRLPVYALQAKLQNLIAAKSRTLSSLGFEQPDAQSWLVFQVMLFLMRRSLEMRENDGCTLQEIEWHLQDVIKNHYAQQPDPEEIQQLVRTIVVDILCNGGAPIIFEAGTDPDEQIPLSFLSSPMVSRGAMKVGAYRMADDGYRILLGTREIEEKMEGTINALILSMQISSRNYKGALQQAQDEIDRLRIQENRIRESILRLKADVLEMSLEETKRVFQENVKIFEEASDRFKDIQQTVSAQISDAEAQLEAGTADEKLQNNLELMNQIESCLNLSVHVTGQILDALNDFLSVRRNEMLNQMGMRSMRKRSIRHDLFEPMIETPQSLDALPNLLHGLFFSQPGLLFSPQILLEMRQLKAEEEEESDSYEEDDPFDPASEQREQRIRQVALMHEASEVFFRQLLKKPDHRLSLADFSRENPVLAGQEAGILKELLASWSMIREIDLHDLFDQEEELDVRGMETLYSLPLSLLEAAKVLPELHGFVQLNIDKADGEVRFSLQEEGLGYQLVIDNFEMSLERRAL